MSKFSTFKEFLQFLLARKKWWLIPVAVCLVLVGVLILLSQNAAVAPFIYTIF